MAFTPDWLTAFATIILVMATLVYVFFTYKLTKETTKLREVETTPLMSMFIKPTQPIELIIENIGKAPAYNINISFDEKYLDSFLFDCTKQKINFSYFSPNQQLIILMKYYHQLKDLKYDYIPIKVTYNSKDNRKFEDTFNISWKELSSAGLEIQSDKLEDISRELKNISNALKKK